MNNSKFLKTAILLCFCSTFISFSNRSINDDQISPLTGLLKCETYAKGFTINYYYNIKRQLLKTQTQYGQITSYDYYDNFIVSKKILSFVNTQYIDTLFYNSAGLIGYRNIYSYSPQENKYYFFSKSRYFYNKDNNLIEWRNIMMDRYHDSTTQIFQYTIENGNVISEKTFYKNTPDKFSLTKYTYFPDKINSLGNSFMGTTFNGTSSKNPIQEEKENADGKYPAIHSYQYKYDNGMITMKIEDKDTITYEYY